MLHSNFINNVIGTQESVYRDSPIGNLDRNIWFRNMTIPLQEGFYSDSKTALPIAIDGLTAFAFEQGIIGTMPFPNSTAVGTPFACVPTIHDVQRNIIIKAPLLENLLELIERNPHNCFVEPSTFWFELTKVLDRNVSIKSFSEYDNFSNDLTKISIDKISFLMLQHFQLFDSVQGLKFCSSLQNLLPFNPYMFSEISLIEYSAFWRNNTNSEVLGININTKNILSLIDFLFLREISYNLQIFGQSESLASPTIINQILKSLIVPILFDWNRNPNFWIDTQSNEEIGLGIEGLTVSRNIKLDGQPVNLVGVLFPSISDKTTSDLNIKGGLLFAN